MRDRSLSWQNGVSHGHHANFCTELAEAVDTNLDLDPHFLSQTRGNNCKKWLHQISLVQRDEDELKRGMSPETVDTLKSKRLMLWKRMLITSGCSGVEFPDRLALRPLGRCGICRDQVIGKTLLEEKEKGWAFGPLEGGRQTLTRRFAVVQGV